jgi:hypothetical protein
VLRTPQAEIPRWAGSLPVAANPPRDVNGSRGGVQINSLSKRRLSTVSPSRTRGCWKLKACGRARVGEILQACRRRRPALKRGSIRFFETPRQHIVAGPRPFDCRAGCPACCFAGCQPAWAKHWKPARHASDAASWAAAPADWQSAKQQTRLSTLRGQIFQFGWRPSAMGGKHSPNSDVHPAATSV